MEQHINVEFEEMASKIQQHEELIIQLLKIIARTNRQVSDLSSIGEKTPLQAHEGKNPAVSG